MLSPMKLKSMMEADTGIRPIRPRPVMTASSLPVFCREALIRSLYRLESLKSRESRLVIPRWVSDQVPSSKRSLMYCSVVKGR